MDKEIIKEGKFSYYESQGGEVNLLLLHGLFGALSNFQGIIEYFKDRANVIVPILPIFELPIKKVGLSGLVDYVEKFVVFKDYKELNVLGNSLGGHIAQLYAIGNPERMNSLILTGSSGLFESGMGNTFPKRGDYEYIKNKTGDTFYDPKVATKELVDEVYGIVNDRNKAIRIIITAKSAIRHNLGDKLNLIKTPTLLVWGLQDKVTPPFVGEKFKELIKDSELIMLDKCGHAPMMERPVAFNLAIEKFLKKHN
jgi:pimeloyl-ACP methyl ester carboxylesterase